MKTRLLQLVIIIFFQITPAASANHPKEPDTDEKTKSEIKIVQIAPVSDSTQHIIIPPDSMLSNQKKYPNPF